MDPDHAYTEWPRERFFLELAQKIREKDRKASLNDRPEFLRGLSRLFIVVHTDEADLLPSDLRDYLSALAFPRPTYVDKAFVLGPYEPAANAHVRGAVHEPAEKPPQYTAFSVKWRPAQPN